MELVDIIRAKMIRAEPKMSTACLFRGHGVRPLFTCSGARNG